MMPHVDGKTLHATKNIFLLSLTHFYSRIILKKLNPDQIGCHRKVERFLTKIVKLKADIKFRHSVNGYRKLSLRSFRTQKIRSEKRLQRHLIRCQK